MIRHLVLFLVFAFMLVQAMAQTQAQKQPLKSVLNGLEDRYALTFSYIDAHIAGINIVPPSEKLTLDDALRYLQQHTGLVFQKLNDQSVVISLARPNQRDVCAYLLDRQTGEPVVGALILNARIPAISDDTGYFELSQLSDSSTLSIHFVGYEILNTNVRELAGSGCDTLYMRQRIMELQEVIIANFITNGINISSDGSFRINAETLGILPGLTDPDVLQTVQALPGIQSINETISDINVRGGTNDQNLIFWEGIKMYQSGHFFGLISAFNPYLIKDVSLIKNGTSAALSDGVSSIIDIHADDRVGQKFSGGAGINLINTDLYLKFPLGEKVAIQLSGRRSISDILQTPTYKQYFNRVFRNTDVTRSSESIPDSLLQSSEKFNFYDVSFKFLYDISPKDKVRLNFLHFSNKINYQENALVNSELDSKTSGLEQQTMASGISYSRLWSNKVRTRAQLFFSSYDLQGINFDVVNQQRLKQENEVLDTGLKLDARCVLTNSLDLLTGYQFFETGITNLEDIDNPPFRRKIKKVIRSHAAFAEGNYSSPSHRTNIRAGLRANYFEKFNGYTLEPRLAFNQRFLQHFSFEVLGEMKSQTTTQVIDLQNDFLGVEKRRWVLANEEDIPIVKSKQVSSGLRYQRKTFLISLNGYLKQVNGITTSSQGFQNQFQYIRSSGTYDVFGLDFLINQRIGYFTTWLSYSYAENQYTFPELIPTIFPNNLDIRHTATFGASYNIKDFQVSAGMNWRTGKPYTEPLYIEDGNIVYDDPNSSRIDDYVRLDISAKYRFSFSPAVRGEFGASIWNLLDNQNMVNTWFQVNDQGSLETIQQFALGFTPNFMFRVSF